MPLAASTAVTSCRSSMTQVPISEICPLADKMLAEDGLKTIFGCYTSSSRKAVLPVVERRNGLLWYPTLYEGFEYSPNIIYTGAAPNQNSVELVDFMVENFGPRLYLIGSDYIYPRESNRIIRELLRQRCGKVVGEHYLDLGAKPSEFRLLMRDVAMCIRTSYFLQWWGRRRPISTRPIPMLASIPSPCRSPV